MDLDAIEKLEEKSPAISTPVATAPIALEKIVVRIPRGAEVGRYIFFLNCRAPWGAVTWGEVRRRAPETELNDQIFQELAAAGFTLVGDRRSPFAPDLKPEFRIAASVESLDMTLCRQTDWLFGYSTGISGEAAITVDWQLYSERARGVVLNARTVGRAERSTGTTDGVGLLIVEAFADAAAQLGADPAFADALNASQPGATPIVAPAAAAVAASGRALPLQVGEAVYGSIHDRSGRKGGIIAGLRWDDARRRWIILADLPHSPVRPEALYDAAGLQIGVAAPVSGADPSTGLIPFLALAPAAVQP